MLIELHCSLQFASICAKSRSQPEPVYPSPKGTGVEMARMMKLVNLRS